jgi:hypothetical protein
MLGLLICKKTLPLTPVGFCFSSEFVGSIICNNTNDNEGQYKHKNIEHLQQHEPFPEDPVG